MQLAKRAIDLAALRRSSDAKVLPLAVLES
jgi:hypothetical protein